MATRIGSPRRKIDHLCQALRRHDPERVYLFGSAAQGEWDDLSDLDVVVIMRTSLPFFERAILLMRDLPRVIGAVDLLVYTPEEWKIMLEQGNAFAELLEAEGKVLYDRQAKR